ncbi:MlaD family protein [Nocardia thailandica]|uniref:MlaD family protein n=1 Tax=Nocardia thailandica TaxID=257275 RepID=UPI000305A30B|nr:MlaD family protein [Nocardia thailandica]
MTRARHLAAVLATATIATGCAAVPGTGATDGTYPLHIEFADVLNLPEGATVIADGVRIGRLTGVRLIERPGSPGGGLVTADIAVDSSVRLPAGTTAELRQETPLGDIHIALTEPAAAAGAALGPGSTIPLTDTTRSPAIEDILAALSVFLGTGAVTDLQDIIRTVNGVMPGDPRDTARLSATLGTDLTDLAGDLGAVDSLLDGLEATLDRGVLANAPVLEELLTPYGVEQTTDAIDAQIGVIFVLTALGPVAPSTTWLGPVLGSLDATVTGVVPMLFGSAPFDTASPSNLKALVDLIHTEILPFADRGPTVDLTRIEVSGTERPPVDEQTGRIIDLLRVIGAVR